MQNTSKQKAIDDFRQITGYDLSQYMTLIQLFLQNYYQDISDWYEGKITQPNSTAFKLLDELLEETALVVSYFTAHKTTFKTAIYWVILEEIEEIQLRLLSIKNLPKFLKSNITSSSYSGTYEVDYTTKKYDNLESIYSKNIEDANSEDRWIDIAFRNNLSESDYSVDTINNLILPLRLTLTQNLTSVIDSSITGEKTYGRDFNKKLTFINDDLEVLSYKDTALQSIDIKNNLQKGDIPEYKNLGLPSNIVGQNIILFQLPSLIRQLRQLYSNDDTFTTLTIVKVSFEQTAGIIEYSIQTVNGETFTLNKEI